MSHPNPRRSAPSSRRIGRVVTAGCLASLVGPATFGVRVAHGQLPGVPTAVGAFVRPGIAVAANVGREAGGARERDDDGRVQSAARWTYGAAVGYAPGSARWQLALGGAAQQWGDGYRDPATAVGGRVVVPVLRRDRFGVSAFAGVGVARARLVAPAVGAVADSDDVVTLRQLPFGAAGGMRGALAGRAWAVSVAPQFVLYRLAAAGDALTASRLRVALLAEAALTSRIGLSVAFEDGARAALDEAGPRGNTLGLALSYALGSR